MSNVKFKSMSSVFNILRTAKEEAYLCKLYLA